MYSPLPVVMGDLCFPGVQGVEKNESAEGRRKIRMSCVHRVTLEGREISASSTEWFGRDVLCWSLLSSVAVKSEMFIYSRERYHLSPLRRLFICLKSRAKKEMMGNLTYEDQ